MAPNLERLVEEIREGTASGPVTAGTRHAHVLHTRGYFSKHDLADGKYDNVDLATLDPRRLNEWCTMIVMQSVRMPDAELAGYARDVASFAPFSPAFRRALDLPAGAERQPGNSSVYSREVTPSAEHCWSEQWERWLPAAAGSGGVCPNP